MSNGGGIMGIFTRLRDIISSNVNAMLDKAEDPEKMVRLMIQEMEDTLVEIKASCAGAMATRQRVQRQLDEANTRAEQWAGKAELAVNKGREDLAREALLERRRYRDRVASLEAERAQCEALVEQYQNDVAQLEDKLATVREKQRVLVERHIHARSKKRAQTDIRRAETSDAFLRFQRFQSRIDHMEAEVDLVNFARKPPLDDEFSCLETDEEIENELTELKKSVEKKTGKA